MFLLTPVGGASIELVKLKGKLQVSKRSPHSSDSDLSSARKSSEVCVCVSVCVCDSVNILQGS